MVRTRDFRVQKESGFSQTVKHSLLNLFSLAILTSCLFFQNVPFWGVRAQKHQS